MNDQDCFGFTRSLMEQSGLPNGFVQDSDIHAKGWFTAQTVPPAVIAMDASDDTGGTEALVEVDIRAEARDLRTVLTCEVSSHSFVVSAGDANSEEKLRSEFNEACYQVLTVH